MASEGDELAARVALLQSRVDEHESHEQQTALAEESRLMKERQDAEAELERLVQRVDAARRRVHEVEAEADALSLGTGAGSLTTLALRRSLAVTLTTCGTVMLVRVQPWWWAGFVLAGAAWLAGRLLRRRA